MLAKNEKQAIAIVAKVGGFVKADMRKGIKTGEDIFGMSWSIEQVRRSKQFPKKGRSRIIGYYE